MDFPLATEILMPKYRTGFLTSIYTFLYNHYLSPPPPGDCPAAQLCPTDVAASSCESQFRLKHYLRPASTLVLCYDPCLCGCRLFCHPRPPLFLHRRLFLPHTNFDTHIVNHCILNDIFREKKNERGY